MKIGELKKRLDRARPMTSVTLRMPEDIVGDLKRVAPMLGYSGYQPLIRAYVGQCLRKDLARLDADILTDFVSNLRSRGVSQQVIDDALGAAAEGDAESTRSSSHRRTNRRD